MTVAWECGECWHTFELHHDDWPDCCPQCDSADIKEMLSDDIPWDLDVRNEDAPTQKSTSKIPTILTDAARLDAKLDELRDVHNAALLEEEQQEQDAAWLHLREELPESHQGHPLDSDKS